MRLIRTNQNYSIPIVNIYGNYIVVENINLKNLISIIYRFLRPNPCTYRNCLHLNSTNARKQILNIYFEMIVVFTKYFYGSPTK